ncbi:DMT family transporter [Saccharomonospora sp. NPDC006951]
MSRDTLIGTGFVLTWSSGFIGSTLATAHASAFTLLLWRFLVVVALLAAWWLVWHRRRLPAKAAGIHGLVGLLSQGVFLFGVVWSAQLGVPAGIAALIAAVQPIATATLSGPLLGERTSRAQWAGLALGIAGVALVVSGDLGGAGTAPPLAYALPVLAMAGLVAGTFAERKAPPLPMADTMLIHAATSTVVFGAIAVTTSTVAPPADGGFWMAVSIVVVLAHLGGYGFYWLNVRRKSVNHTSTLLYLTPPTTMVFGYLLFDERLGALSLIGLVVCLVAVLLAIRSTREVSVPREMMAACSSPTLSTVQPRSARPGRERPRSPSSSSC